MTSHGEDSAATGRLAVLDAFRAVAILAVLIHHFFSRWAPPDHPTNLYGYSHSYPQWLDIGALGVQFFFVISGFVIFMTLERCRHLFEFWARRIARLYPAYLVATLITFVAANWLGPAEFSSSASDAAISLAFLTTFVPGARWVEPAYWSLAVEMQFYFWIGLIYAFSRENFVRAWCGFTLLGLALWIAGTPDSLHLLRNISRYVFLAPYLPHFTAGVMFYLLYRGRRQGCAALGLLSLVTYAVTAIDQPVASHYAHVVMIAAFALFLRGQLAWLAVRPLVWVGECSYALYLLHQYLGVMMIGALTSLLGLPDLLAASLATAACLALAGLLQRTVEQPGKAWLTGRLSTVLETLSAKLPRLAYR